MDKKIAHFFDINSIIMVKSKVWVVDKKNPTIPLLCISQSDYNLIKNGIYKSQNNSITFSDYTYWFPDDIFNDLKISIKNNKSNLANIGFSMKEFTDVDIVEKSDIKINMNNISHLNKTNDDMILICSSNNRKIQDVMVSKIKKEFSKIGLDINYFYHISETFFNRNSDEISHKKVRILLQHMVGLKTDGDKFTKDNIPQYDIINYYDDESNSIEFAKKSNKFLMFLISNSDDDVKLMVKDKLQNEHKLIINKVTFNKSNKFITTVVKIKIPNLITVFENFKSK